MKKTLIALVIVVITALGLAACGSSSGDKGTVIVGSLVGAGEMLKNIHIG